MIRKFFVTTIATAAISAFGVTYTYADHGDLAGDEVKKVVSGTTAKGTTGSGRNFATKIGADGSLNLNIVESGFTDTGKWTVEGDKYCSQFVKVRNGNKQCSTIRHMNGNKYLFKSDSSRTAMTLTK